MKTNQSLRAFLLFAGSALLATSATHAADTDGTWTKNATGTLNWSDTGNWSGSNVADGIGYSAYLSNVITDNRTITLDTARTIGNIYAQDIDKNYTISGADTLTLDVATGASILSVVTGRTLTISTPVTINDGLQKDGAGTATLSGALTTLSGPQTWTSNAGTLNVTGGLNNGGFTLTIEGAGNISFGGTANIITGTGGITKNGTGLLTLGAGGTTPAHNYSGATVINGGIVMTQNNLSANSNYTLNNAIFSDYYQSTTTFTGLGTGSKEIQIYGASGFGGGNGNSNWRIGAQNSTLTWGTLNENSNVNATGFFNPTTLKLRSSADNNGPTIWGQVTFQNRLDLNSGARTIDVLLGSGNIGNSRATIANGIQDTGATGSLTVTGGGMLSLGVNTSTWGGNTTISAGILDFLGTDENNIGGGSARNISVAAGAGVRFNALSNAILNRIVETTNEIGVMTGGTGNSFNFSSTTGATLPNAFLGNWAGNGAKAEMSGIITPGSNGYKFGALGSNGLLGIRDTLSGANSLTVGMTGSSGIRVNIVAANTHTGETVINAGSRLTLGNNLALQNSPLNVGSAGGNFSLAAGTNAGRITGETAAPSPTFGGLIGSRNLYSVFSSAVGNNETNLANTAVTGFTLNVGTGNTFTYSGNIGGFGTGAGTGGAVGTLGDSTLTKTGNGTQILTGVSTYTGATTITGGTLEISGAGSINNSAVTVNGGTFRYNSSVAYSGTLTFTSGTLAGINWTGTLAGQTIGTNQTISPGNSPGTAATGAQTWAPGGSYNWEVNNATGTVGADPGWDLLSGTGTLDITATSSSKFDINVTSLTLGNIAGNASGFVSTNTYNWLIADFNLINGFAADAFNIDTTKFSNTFTGTFGISLGGGSLPGDSSQIYLTYVPESGTALLGGVGLLALLRRRRNGV